MYPATLKIMKNRLALFPAILLSIAAFSSTGCLKHYYYEHEVTSVEALTTLLPQEGTTLVINLEEKLTKCFSIIEAKDYRYRVLVDGEIYSQGEYYRPDIPLYENDSHKRKEVIVEGSQSRR